MKGVAGGSQKHTDEKEAGMAAEAFAFAMIAWEVSGEKGETDGRTRWDGMGLIVPCTIPYR